MDLFTAFVQMLVSAVLIVLSVTLIYVAERKTRECACPVYVKPLALSLVFAFLVVVVVRISPGWTGAVDNIQDVIPLCVGLIFGAPAGILTGVFSAVFLLFAAPAGLVLQAQCISLFISGVFAAFLRHFIFDDKTTTPFYGVATCLVNSVGHVLIMIIWQIGSMQVIHFVLTYPAFVIIALSAVTTLVSLQLVSAIGKEKAAARKGGKGIAQSFQRWLLVCVVAAFAVTCSYSWVLQTQLAYSNADKLLKLNILDLRADIVAESNKKLLRITHDVAQRITPECYSSEWNSEGVYNAQLTNMLDDYNITEINLIDERGINVASTNPAFPGYNMANGAQSAAFLQLLHGKEELVQEYQAIASDSSIYRKYAGVALPNGGFAQVGYDAAHFQRGLEEALQGFTQNTHIGESGGTIICNEKGVIVSDNSGYEGDTLQDMGLVMDPQQPADKRFSANIHGIESFCMYDVAEGFLIITYIPYGEVVLFRNIALFITAFMEIVLFALVFLLIYFLIKKIVVENIHRINASLDQISRGNLNVRVEVRTNDEFTFLSDDINSTVDTLKQYIAEAAARIDKELEFAQTIQMSALPSVFPPYPERHELDLYATMKPAREVGGDFYDFYIPGSETLGLYHCRCIG